LEEIRNRQVDVFKMYKEFSTVSLHKLFILNTNSEVLMVIHANWMRPAALGRDITKYFFSSKVINRWYLLDQWTVDAPSINAFKCGLCYIRDNRMGFFMD